MAAPKRKVTIAFALTILSLIAYSQAFHSFWSVQQWPPAVCITRSGNCVGSGLEMFTIHGLWPQRNGKSVVYCACTPLDINELSNQKPHLNEYWPDVIKGDNESFWNYEWKKHGTCSESEFKQAAYFQLALNHRFNYDIMKVLIDHEAGPNDEEKETQEVKEYIFQEFGKVPGLRCKNDSKTNKSYLVEIVLCFGKDGVTLINCTKDRCGQDFYF